MAEKTKEKKNSSALVVVLSVIVVALVVTVVLLLNRQGENKVLESVPEPEKRNVVVNEDNVEEVLEQLTPDDFVQAGSYEVTMNTTWRFKDGMSPSENAYVENALSNTNDVYFDVLLAESEEKIYSSPLLPLGSHIENITLDKALIAGTYDCVLIYYLVDEEQNVLGDLRVGLTIDVEN